MRIGYQLTRDDVAAASAAMMTKGVRVVFAVAAVVALGASLPHFLGVMRQGETSEAFSNLLPFAVMSFVFIAMIFLSPRLAARKFILRRLAWDFEADSVHIDSEVANATVQWAAFVKYRETPKVFLLYIQKSQAQFIPKRVLNAEQIAELRTLLDAHVPRK